MVCTATPLWAAQPLGAKKRRGWCYLAALGRGSECSSSKRNRWHHRSKKSQHVKHGCKSRISIYVCKYVNLYSCMHACFYAYKYAYLMICHNLNKPITHIKSPLAHKIWSKLWKFSGIGPDQWFFLTSCCCSWWCSGAWSQQCDRTRLGPWAILQSSVRQVPQTLGSVAGKLRLVGPCSADCS